MEFGIGGYVFHEIFLRHVVTQFGVKNKPTPRYIESIEDLKKKIREKHLHFCAMC